MEAVEDTEEGVEVRDGHTVEQGDEDLQVLADFTVCLLALSSDVDRSIGRRSVDRSKPFLLG